MKPVIYEVWGQCDHCKDAFSVYLHQRNYRDGIDYSVEPSPHLEIRTRHQPHQRPLVTLYHLHNTCGGRVRLFGKLPATA